jgi:hypothetical protein
LRLDRLIAAHGARIGLPVLGSSWPQIAPTSHRSAHHRCGIYLPRLPGLFQPKI